MSHEITQFSDRLLAWFDHHGRKDLPWQVNKTPYRVWISEIMLQQTQVTTVIPYYERFMASFPTLEALAQADQDDVLAHWSGLGYYARARNLHKAAQQCVTEHEGMLPASAEALQALPGIGRSTAGAILSIAGATQAAILDGNVKRVLTRCFGIAGWPGSTAVEKALWALAERLTPPVRFDEYTQAIMDLGATLCTRTRAKCHTCPFQSDCFAHQHDRVNAFPERKPTQKKPTRHACFLVIQNDDGQILVEKQPDSGIWGGLWSLPSAEMTSTEDPMLEAEMNHLVKDRAMLHQSSARYMDPRTHVFSHFILVMRPIHLHASAATQQEISAHCALNTPEERVKWIRPEDMVNVGLPAPISKIIQRVFSEEQQMNLLECPPRQAG